MIEYIRQLRSNIRQIWDPTNTQRLSLHTLKLRTLKVLLGFGSTALMSIWIMEGMAGRLVAIDLVAYPIMLFVYLAGFVSISVRPQSLWLVEKASFGILAAYAVSYILALTVGASKVNYYALASFTQWLPLVYIAAYVFLEERHALVASVLIYLAFLCCVGLRALQGPPSIWQTDEFLILFNMLCAHPVYVAVLSAFALLKSWFAKAQTHAEIMSVAANIDYLTSTANRRATVAALNQGLNIPPTGVPLAVLLFDIDHFKQINDSYGHDVGDTVLIELANLFRSHLRSSDMLGRWGGEEFIVVAFETPLAEAIALAERLRQLAASQLYAHGPHLTISCGVAIACSLDTPDAVVKRADQALYRAKQQGRNRVEVAE